MLRILKLLLYSCSFSLYLYSAMAFAESNISTEQKTASDDRFNLDNLMVVGHRASQSSSQARKRQHIELIDSIVAEDINKLPDMSVTEALQRIPGVQITRDRGEGDVVTIRGLSQMETMINGREIFTAGNGRNLNFNDLPAEMVAGIDVYKTSSASQIEGGIGGTIDVRTRKPFDFDGEKLFGSVGYLYGDLIDKTESQMSLLATNRWQSDYYGEFGALVLFSKQTRPWREDQKVVGTPMTRDDLVVGQTTIAPSGGADIMTEGDRERSSASIILQWQPSSAWQFYGEGNYAELLTHQNTYQFGVAANASTSFLAGSPVLFPGTQSVQNITWTNATMYEYSAVRDTTDRTHQLAFGGAWTGENLKLSSDLSYTQSYNNLFNPAIFLTGTAANFSQNLSGSIPGSTVTGTDLLDPANYTVAAVLFTKRPFEGDLGTLRFDGEYWLDNNSVVDSIIAGVRIAQRRADNGSGEVTSNVSTSLSGSAVTDYLTVNPYTNFFSDSSSISSYLAGDVSAARGNLTAWREAFGVTSPIPVSNPSAIWHISEETWASYVMANIESDNLPLEGNVGVRIVQTQTSIMGWQGLSVDSGTTAFAPLNRDTQYIDFLPSFNMRYEFLPDFFVRVAASETITRPNFNQLSPSINLFQYTATPERNVGFAGNSNLKPIRSKNVDLALEKYVNPHTSVYLTTFFKKVDGFISTVSSAETYSGVTYQVSRPENNNPADILGAEIGYQQFYDFLPGWMSGLGLQANYTYVYSKTKDDSLDQSLPLQNLSKHSLNIIGMYEKNGVSARLAYNWRDKYLSATANVVGIGSIPIYTEAYDWLDASISYKLSDALTLKLEGTNLLNTIRRSYYGNSHLPSHVWMNDRQFRFLLSMKI